MSDETKVTPTRKPGERAYRVERIELADGRVGWLYSDNSVRNDKGQLMEPHPDAAPPITSANSAQMRMRRAMKHAEATAQGLLASARRNVGTDKVPGTLAAWSAAVERLSDTFWDKATKPRDQAEIIKAIALALDAIPARVPQADAVGPDISDADAEFLKMLARRARQMVDERKARQPET